MNTNWFFKINLLSTIVLMLAWLDTGVFAPKYIARSVGHVLQASTGTNTVRFYYDGAGQRIVKIDPSSTGVNTYYVSPELEIVADKTGKITWRKNYYYNGKAVAVKTSDDAITPLPTPTPIVNQFGVLVSRGASVTASNTNAGSNPENVVDGSETVGWNSGAFAPQWVQIDLGSAKNIKNIRLKVNQNPASGATIHRIYAGATTSSMTLVREFNGTTTSGQWLLASFATSIANVRYVKVETTTSPSWVSWTEIEVYE